MTERYAVYFSPADKTPLAHFGEIALGRDSEGRRVSPSKHGFVDHKRFKELTSVPAHYGFHATLKAPFALVQGVDQAALMLRAESVADSLQAVEMPELAPRPLANFLALGFEKDPSEVRKLADTCAIRFNNLRAPLTEIDLKKRQVGNLTDFQQHYLMVYGYPYVLHEFRFHMTLTGRFDDTRDMDFYDWLNDLYEGLVEDAPILDRLVIFRQPDRRTPFSRIQEFPVGQDIDSPRDPARRLAQNRYACLN